MVTPGDQTRAPVIDGAYHGDLQAIIRVVNEEAEHWRDTLSVSIGRASALTGLKETQIRYFEELKALRPEKTTDQAGSNRLYTIADLRRLRVLALLLKHHRPAEAAEIVRQHARLFDAGSQRSLSEIAVEEDSAFIHGFLLTGLMSQIIDATQAELRAVSQAGAASDANPAAGMADQGQQYLRVTGLILPMEPIFGPGVLSREEVQRVGQALEADLGGRLVALDRAAVLAQPDPLVPLTLIRSGRDDSTLLLYSREPWVLPLHNQHYCAYLPEARPDLTVLLLIAAEAGATAPHLLQPLLPARRELIDRSLSLCETLFTTFRSLAPAHGYRYRSDGFQLAQTRESYSQILATIRTLIFGDDRESMAALFAPNSLERPTSLSILAHHNYSVPGAKIDLSHNGQGLSGRAYNLREPFFSLHASNDPRITYAQEERCQVALAVPLVISAGMPPFGVLYLASQNPAVQLRSEAIYTALMLGSILSELLGRWWLTRLRRAREALLHERISTMIEWLDSLDQHGPNFERAIARIEAILQEVDPDEAALQGCI